MQMSDMGRLIGAAMIAGSFMFTGGPVSAADAKTTPETGETKAEEVETKAPTHCEDVQITVKNASGQPIKLINVDYATTRRWKRGRIVFRTIADGASHTWSGSFKDLGGQKVKFRVNTRYVIDEQTDRYTDLKSTTLTTSSCTSKETHEITIGKP